MNNFFCNFEAIDLIPFAYVHIWLGDENYLKKKNFCSHSAWFFWKKMLTSAKNAKHDFSSTQSPRELKFGGNIPWVIVSELSYRFLKKLIFRDFMAKNCFLIFFEKMTSQKCPKKAEKYFFRNKTYKNSETTT